MTWIVGINATEWAPDRAFLVSDTRASWPNGQHVDCVQKIRSIGPTTLAGFAGSVRLGFEALDCLQSELNLFARAQRPFRAVAMDRVPRLLRWMFRKASSTHRRLGLEIILADASGRDPTTLVCAFRAPHFSFETIPCGDAAISVGSGTARFLDAFRRFPEPVLSTEHRLQGGAMVDLDFVGTWVNRIVTENPEPTVGTGFHAGAAAPEGVMGPRFCQMEIHPIPTTLELQLPVFDPNSPPTHSHFVTGDDGTFGFYVSGPGGMTNVLSLLRVPDKGVVVAHGASPTLEHVTSYSGLQKVARSRGLSAASEAAAVDSATPLDSCRHLGPTRQAPAPGLAEPSRLSRSR